MILRVRFAVATAAAVTAAILAVTFLLYLAERRDLTDSADADLAREAEFIAARLAEGGPNAALLTPDLGRPYELHAELVTADGSVVALEPVGAFLPVPAPARSIAAGTTTAEYSTATVGDRQWRMLTVPVPEGPLVVARSMEDVHRHLRYWVTGRRSSTGVDEKSLPGLRPSPTRRGGGWVWWRGSGR